MQSETSIPTYSKPTIVIFGSVLSVAFFGLIIFPIPTWMLDFLLIKIILISAIILAALLAILCFSISIRYAALSITITVLAGICACLNIASTRLILSQAYAGEWITAFGNIIFAKLPSEGNFVIPIILSVVNVVFTFCVVFAVSVIARSILKKSVAGAEDYQASSLISHIGTPPICLIIAACLAIFLAVLNMLGGSIIGIVQRDMTVNEALRLYTMLTVGDVQVQMIPLILLSLSSLILIVRMTRYFKK